MSITEAEEALFQRWAPSRPGFVRDGVVDEDGYVAGGKRILFVLKEVNDTTGEFKDLRPFLREGGRAQTWNNVTRWIEGIRKMPTELAWEDLREVDDARRAAALRTVAVMNLKKSPGGSSSDPHEIRDAAVADRQFLNEQFKLYDPDLVICCGSPVGALVHELIEPVARSSMRRTRRGAYVYGFGDHQFMVDYWHPQYQIPPELLYYHLIDTVHEISDPPTSKSR